MRALKQDLIVALFTAGAPACTLAAPGDDELFDGSISGAGRGGRSIGNGGMGGTTAGASGGGGASAGDPGAGFGGRGGSGGLSGESGNLGAMGGGAAAGSGAGGALGEGGAAGGSEAGEGGSAGSGGAEPVCTVECGTNEECTATMAGGECVCVAGFVRDGACRFPRSCAELHRASPALPSGSYTLQPAGDASGFLAYCGMMLEGGGWTLAVSDGPSFDTATMGVTNAVCYSSNCANIAYSRVLLESDVMIDVSNSPITNATYTARLIVSGVHTMSRGKTLRTLFTTGPNYVEAEDNSNVAVRMIGGADCNTLPRDMATAACNECATVGCKVPVMVFGDGDSGCETPAPRFALGAATDYTTGWTNCAGWPQSPNHSGIDSYPDYVRVWIR
jgi:hypothetical protein